MTGKIEIYKNRPTRAVISLENLRNNLSVVKSYLSSKTKILVMVKANAYGHGILEISKELIKNGVNYLGVAYIEEAVYLRENEVTVPILVTGVVNSEQIETFLKYDIAITSSSIEKSKQISDVAVRMNKQAVVHLKVDTGMERIGVHWYNAQKFIEESYFLQNIKIKGIFSHFAKAENDRKFTEQQIKRFDDIVNFLESKNIRPELIHLANSAGIVLYPSSHYDMVRPGIALYGYLEGIQNKLKPVMSLKTKVSFFKVVPKNIGIGYELTYITNKQTRVVTLPIGYGDGYSRYLSNKGEVIIRGKKHLVVGNVAMDQIMVDIGMYGEAYNGDDVLLFGEDGDASVSLGKLCTKIGAIPHEIICGISQRVPRVYV